MFHIIPITVLWQICKTKKCAKSWQIGKKNCKSIHKNTHLWTTKPTPHTWVSFLGQVNMHNYSSWYLLTHTIIPKCTWGLTKSILELPPTLIRKEPPYIPESTNSNNRKFCRTFDYKYIGEWQKNINCTFSRCSPTNP